MILCPKNPFWLVTKDGGGTRLPVSCMSYLCPICRQGKIRERVKVMGWGASQADRVRLLTLTMVPTGWQHAREQIRDWVRRVRKAYRTEMAWAIEVNPKGTGHHMHAIQWGDYLPQHRLQEMWGDRIVDIRPIEAQANGYVAKCAMVAGYLSKEVLGHLEENGGRAVHMTRGYLHGLTSRQVRKELSTGKKWFLIPATLTEVRESLAATMS